MKQPITLQEVAYKWSVTERTLRRWIKRGKLRPLFRRADKRGVRYRFNAELLKCGPLPRAGKRGAPYVLNPKQADKLLHPVELVARCRHEWEKRLPMGSHIDYWKSKGKFGGFQRSWTIQDGRKYSSFAVTDDILSWAQRLNKKLSPRQMDYIAAMFIASANPEIKWTYDYIDTIKNFWKVLSQRQQSATGVDKVEINRDIRLIVDTVKTMDIIRDDAGARLYQVYKTDDQEEEQEKLNANVGSNEFEDLLPLIKKYAPKMVGTIIRGIKHSRRAKDKQWKYPKVSDVARILVINRVTASRLWGKIKCNLLRDEMRELIIPFTYPPAR